MRAIPLSALLLAALFPLTPADAAGCSGGPLNDCRADAIEWFGQPIDITNVGATMEAGEPASCGTTPVHRSVWLRLDVVAGAADPFMVEFDAPFFATAAAYTESGGALTLVRCDGSFEDEGLHSPVLFLPCSAGTTYWFQVGSQSAGAGGSVGLFESRYWKFDQTLSEPCTFEASLPGAPSLAPATSGAGEVSLGWVEPYWDGGRTVSLTGYHVYRAATCAGPFALVGANAPADRWWTDEGLAPGASFCYRVTAVNPVGEGPASVARAGASWSLPRAPATLSVTRAGDGELQLAWPASPDQQGPAPMSGFRVYRAASAEGVFEPVATVAASARGYKDAGLADGVTMWYRVSAVSAAGEGAQGAVGSSTTWAVPGVPRSVEAAPVLLGEPAIRITWEAPADATPFTKYRIYAAWAEDPFTHLADVNAGTTTYWDEDMPLLVTARYEVRAYNPAGESAAPPAACAVYPVEAPWARC